LGGIGHITRCGETFNWLTHGRLGKNIFTELRQEAGGENIKKREATGNYFHGLWPLKKSPQWAKKASKERPSSGPAVEKGGSGENGFANKWAETAGV